MEAFIYEIPTRVIFGKGAEQQVSQEVLALGARSVLLVYGGKSAERSGLLDLVSESLKKNQIQVLTLGGVQPNPRLSLVRTGIDLALEKQVDCVIGIGGGSVLDTAKAIADGAANPEWDIWEDIWLKRKSIQKSLPVGCILTIPAAGSETSDSAVITNDSIGQKRGLNAPCHRPRFALMNPEWAYTLPEYQLRCGVVDILMHTLERYFNPVTTNAMTDGIAEALLRTVIRFGPALLKNPRDYQSMSELMWAGSLSHNGLTGLGGVSDFSTHQLGHVLGARFDEAHGATLSAMWSSWARYVFPQNPERFAQYGETVWGLNRFGRSAEEVGQEAIDRTEAFFQSIGMPISLGELSCGVQSEDMIRELARDCSYQGTRTVGSFRPLEEIDLIQIYQMANH